MKKKKLLSLLLATSMVVTGSVGTYMGQVIYKTTAKAWTSEWSRDYPIGTILNETRPKYWDRSDLKVDGFCFKINCHSDQKLRVKDCYQKDVEDGGKGTATKYTGLFLWDEITDGYGLCGVDTEDVSTYDKSEWDRWNENYDVPSRNLGQTSITRDRYGNKNWTPTTHKEYQYNTDDNNHVEMIDDGAVSYFDNAEVIGVDGEKVCYQGYQVLLENVRDEIKTLTGDTNFNVKDGFLRQGNIGEINTLEIDGSVYALETDKNDAWGNYLANKAKNIVIKGDTTLKSDYLNGESITFTGKVTLEADNCLNNFKHITFNAGASLNSQGHKLCDNASTKLHLHDSICGVKGKFDTIEIWEEGKTYEKGAFDEVTCNAVNVNKKNTKFTGAGIKKSTIKDINILAEGSAEFGNAGIEGTKITGDFNVQGATTFAGGAIQDCEINAINLDAKAELQADAIKASASGKTSIKTLSVNNAAVNWQDGVLTGGTIEKLCFNANPSYKGTANKGIGAGGTVKEIYFNYTDINKKVINVDNINLPLGTDAKTSLKCEKIYFFNPAVKLGKATTYKNVGGAKNTEIYYFGGQNGKDTNDANKLKSLDTIIRNMTGNDEKCTYKCVDGTIKTDIKLTKKADSKDVVYTVPGGSELDYATAVTVTRKIDAATLKEQQYYVANSAKWNSNDVTLKLTTKATDNTGVEFYRILKEDSKVKDYSATQYNVKYKDKWYTAVTAAKETLNDEGTVNYIVEAAGSITPFAVEVLSSKVKSIKAEVVKGAEKVGVGSSVSSEMLKVTATYGNGKTAELGAADYEIEAVKIVEGTNKVTITLKSDNTIKTTVTVEGVKCELESFIAVTEKKEMYVNSSLNLSDVKLNVKYSNIDSTSVVDDEFKFVVDNQEVDFVTIKEGENVIAISYKGKVVEGALVINGVKPNYTNVVVDYKGGPVHEMQKVDPSCVVVSYVDANEPGVVKTDITGTGISFGDYTIEAGKDNEITVFYCGVQAENTIIVKGLTDEIKVITQADYRGEVENGKTIDPTKFHLVFETYENNVVSSNDIKGAANKITVDKEKFIVGLNIIHVSYEGRLSYDCKIVVEDNTPPEPTIRNGSVIVCNGVKYKTISQKNHTGAIIGYDKSASKVVFKTSFKISGVEFKVTKIEKNAFKGCKKLKGTLKINGNIATIGDNAFMGCVNIKKVIIGEKVKTIGKKCFYGCKKLKKVGLLDAKTLIKCGKIGKDAFKKVHGSFAFDYAKSKLNRIAKLVKGTY